LNTSTRMALPPTASEGDSTAFIPIIYQRRADGTVMRDNLGSPIPVKPTLPPQIPTHTSAIPILTGTALEEAWDLPYDSRIHNRPKTPGNSMTLNDQAYSAYLQGLTPREIWDGSFCGPADDKHQEKRNVRPMRMTHGRFDVFSSA
ncbi:hypothetical protein Q9L58_010745, partial [Maublancomyces gigas]